MDETIKALIKLNIKMEGALRVAAERETPEAVEAAKEIYLQMGEAMSALDIAAHKPAEATAIKEEEAVGAEEAPLSEPDSRDMRGAEVVYDDAGAAEAGAEAAEKADDAPFAFPQTPQGAKISASDIRSCFTLNDVFLFRRELFGNSQQEFDDTIRLLASMHSIDEVKEYLLVDLQWDPERPEVKDFLGAVENVFSSKGR